MKRGDLWADFRSNRRGRLLTAPLRAMESHLETARVYFECRRRGLTVRSSSDCPIAQIALEDGLALLHSDRDYETIARVGTRLALLPTRG